MKAKKKIKFFFYIKNKRILYENYRYIYGYKHISKSIKMKNNNQFFNLNFNL